MSVCCTGHNTGIRVPWNQGKVPCPHVELTIILDFHKLSGGLFVHWSGHYPAGSSWKSSHYNLHHWQKQTHTHTHTHKQPQPLAAQRNVKKKEYYVKYSTPTSPWPIPPHPVSCLKLHAVVSEGPLGIDELHLGPVQTIGAPRGDGAHLGHRGGYQGWPAGAGVGRGHGGWQINPVLGQRVGE